ncbi:sialate O-acetylesterase [Dyadobacter jejuensis]|uniref:Sialate O-acetylesterase n=1 Tax=Dyadobacter jejuensis TaxID=1082580 RepID=A0A316AEX6_9BACT|nr:sialate O-acetylesterase [Dyadobacter jejuensis]PWJ55919.1 sialate O-acetylesterase [Dyadobacter jejuensis]
MKVLTTLRLTVAALLLAIGPLMAEIKLPAIVSSNMILQRNAKVVLWGWADPQERITIQASWLKGRLRVQADQDGHWRQEVQTTNSKAPQTIQLKGNNSDINLDNILFGEVWLCSGQSNMQQPVTGYNGQPTFGTIEAVTHGSNPNLRLFTVKRVGAKTPLEDVKEYTAWQQASPDNVGEFSAVGYYFGQQLQQVLDVPVGIIHTSWGGSIVEAWMSNETLSAYQKIDLTNADLSKSHGVKTALFNAMINPLIPFTIKGALWYQGESNRNQPEAYKELFPAMVKDWRTRWNNGDFPFYYVQIAPFGYKDSQSAFIREAQLQCEDLIPNAGMAVAMDLGKEMSIHPPYKKEVADRLLYLALNKTYGFSKIDCAGPKYVSSKQQDGGMVLQFDHAETGLYSTEGLEGFEIAGADKVFHPADAKIVGTDKVLVKSIHVASPVAVRYAWENWIIGSLFDTNMLPASSFRTDTWEEPVKISQK